ncbi:amino acid ABC transporter permease [Paenibacillus sp. PK4536]|uniref:Amino acid ABC transporter permease n=2 Tax=Paenibacillus TaxID=44249 RepID=A0ABW4US98_9BACL|nr:MULTISPECIES: amino acid ABC transporter permease [Paenibacillus]MDN4618865.1 amino acid ABC transporter permease [Paenibacillus sp. PsM32]WCT54782.1 amino acid ABC transporter permease [Paenibacillus kyungheensis]WDF52074.1 amino acid ABC transporter permease [Paenibacillus sp. KACC 21273]WIM39229.1 amino acid ABC transporter permease [Paenibacillus sp. PK4536]CAJ1314074.1 Cysteine ABC transporter permease [Paenibacillus nuruki]
MDDRQIEILVNSFWPMLEAGIRFTIPLAIFSFIIGLILAVLTALARLSGVKILDFIARFYIWIIRGTPLIVQLAIIFYGLPTIGIELDPFPAALIGFSLSVGAYGSEIVRAAIQSIHKGQWEAAYSLGMTRGQALRRIILPQAARVSLPPLSNSFISLVKDTSLAGTVTYVELFRKSEEIVATTYEYLLVYSEAAVIYLVFTSILSFFQNKLEKRLGRSSAD